MKKPIRYALIIFVLLLGFILFSNYWVKKQSATFLYESIDKIPKNKTGLVLGTVKNLANGNTNPYFQFRINAAVKLYKAGKINKIIVSGDNHRADYNEPEDMQKALIQQGIPKNNIYLDFAGFRTFDSVLRSKAIFQQDEITIISQKFHNQRAVYIAQQKGIKAIAFNAKDVGNQFGFKTKLREIFAKVKVIIDLHLINKKPKFLGEPIPIS